jgi:hypothetical protein
MRGPRDRLREILARPELAKSLELADWDLVVPQSRRSGLLARLGIRLEEAGLLEQVPPPPRRHMESDRILAEKLARDVRREVRYVRQALAEVGVPIILLKGAAYVVSDLPAARGRLFTDIDFMVAHAYLAEVEAALLRHGWVFGEISPYDERYYRLWMHQIPPLTHFQRHTTIDVHHTIVAPTTRLKLDAQKLFDAAVPVAGDPLLKVLAPTDMILHSATHLLNEGQFERGLRDLEDLNQLLRHFGRDPDFWPRLVDRAEALDLARPLFYALRYTATLLGTPVPESVRNDARLRPGNAIHRAFMDGLFERALASAHPDCRDSLSHLALWLLYLRAHALLMPPHILVPHLARKSWQRVFPEKEEKPT